MQKFRVQVKNSWGDIEREFSVEADDVEEAGFLASLCVGDDPSSWELFEEKTRAEEKV